MRSSLIPSCLAFLGAGVAFLAPTGGQDSPKPDILELRERILQDLKGSHRWPKPPSQTADRYLRLSIAVPELVDRREDKGPIIARATISNVWSFDVALFCDPSPRVTTYLRFESLSRNETRRGVEGNLEHLIFDLADLLSTAPDGRGFRLLKPGESVDLEVDISPILRPKAHRGEDFFAVRAELISCPWGGRSHLPEEREVYRWANKAITTEDVLIAIGAAHDW